MYVSMYSVYLRRNQMSLDYHKFSVAFRGIMILPSPTIEKLVIRRQGLSFILISKFHFRLRSHAPELHDGTPFDWLRASHARSAGVVRLMSE